MAADAASQGDAPSKTADTPSQEDKLRAAAPTPPDPAKDFEEADDAFDPEFTKLLKPWHIVLVARSRAVFV